MNIYLLDINEDITDCWRLYFADAPDVSVVQDDFAHFMDTHEDVECVVSPANSPAAMDWNYAASRRLERIGAATLRDYEED